MAIAYRATSSGGTTGSGASSVVVTKPTGTVDGDLLVVIVTTAALAPVIAVTPPAGWTLRASKTTSTEGGLHVYTKTASSEGASWTFTLNFSIQNAWAALAFSGSPLYKSVAAAGSNVNTSSPQAPTIVAAVGDLMIAIVAGPSASGSGRTFTAPSGMTERADQNSSTTAANTSAATLDISSGGATGAKTFTASGDLADYYGVSILLSEGNVTANGALATVAVAGKNGVAATDSSAAGALATVAVAGYGATLSLATTGAKATVDVDGLPGVISSGAEGQGQAGAVTVVGYGGTYGYQSFGAAALVTVAGLAGAASFAVSAAGALATVAVQSFGGTATRTGGSGQMRPGVGRFSSPRLPSGTFKSIQHGVGRFFGPRGGMGR